ncbi:hypothetical protein [Caballeronia sp. LZ001]|uniref:hypothetical protein n=1 Tax=Caballeronia sp. LZ001 TaxID=3038553 RepID=UPI002856EC3A|nr:hypothetical protein [Caballeronia sp. LZ001]MDR5802344.1 hypothetical protein [Caballeronia sp. LZ001]
MTPARFQAALSGQSAIAKKVLEMVPKQDAWSRNEIAMHLRRVTKSSPDVAVLDGCLLRLQEAGLVREKFKGRFQRVEVREKESMVTVAAKQIESSSAGSVPSHSVLDILSALSGRARKLAGDLTELASDVETAALTIEQRQAQDSADLAKLRQFQALFKSLA